MQPLSKKITIKRKSGGGNTKKLVANDVVHFPPPITQSPQPPPLLLQPQPPSRSPSQSPMRSRGLFNDLTDLHVGGAQRFTLVIDLDATFVSTHVEMGSYTRAQKMMETVKNKETVEDIRTRTFIFTLGKEKMWTILRPGAMEFIEFASFYFKHISVWSAGQREYVDQIVSFLFPPGIPRPSVVFSWSDCAIENEKCDKSASPSNQDFISFTKPLTAMFPHGSSGMSLKTMFILDDRSDIAEHNMQNLVKIPPFEPKLSELTAPDDALDKFASWLMRPEVITCVDVRKLDKNCIF